MSLGLTLIRSQVGQGIRRAIEDCRKLLPMATPLRNSPLDLYGLSSLIDDRLFGDVSAFRSLYVSATRSPRSMARS